MDSTRHGMRSDWPLIKHLSKTYNPKLGFFWQQLPYVELPHRVFHADSAVLAGSAEHFPWRDVLVRTGAHYPSMGGQSLEVFTRISASEDYKSVWRSLSPWSDASEENCSPSFLTCEVWIRALPGETGFLREPDVCLIPADRLWDNDGGPPPVAYCQSYMVEWLRRKGHPASVQSECMRMLEDHCIALRWVIGYLSQCPEYLVEAIDISPIGAHRSVSDPKPWTYQWLPKWVLMNAAGLPAPDAPSCTLGGTHASPRPHQRRGNWHTLKHPKWQRNPDGSVRRVFVKPAWVGPREWIMEGTRYRVVDTAPETQEVGPPDTATIRNHPENRAQTGRDEA